jgi:hypothetical protein
MRLCGGGLRVVGEGVWGAGPRPSWAPRGVDKAGARGAKARRARGPGGPSRKRAPPRPGALRRGATSSHRTISHNTRSRAQGPTAPRRPAAGHDPRRWHAKRRAGPRCARLGGSASPIWEWRAAIPATFWWRPLPQTSRGAAAGHWHTFSPGRVPTSSASQLACGMVLVRGTRLPVQGSVSWCRAVPVTRTILAALVPGWCSSGAAGRRVCAAPFARGPPGVRPLGGLPVSSGAGGGGSLGGGAAWVPRHFCSRCLGRWHRGWAWRDGRPRSTFATGPAGGVVCVCLPSGMAGCPGRGLVRGRRGPRGRLRGS